MRLERLDLYRQLEALRESRLIVYITGDRLNMETIIASDSADRFVHHLDAIGDVDRITLYLYSRGGDLMAGWRMINTVRQFCKTLEVIVPDKAHSTATLMCLGADTVVMTKQATLSPIDPTVNSLLNPLAPSNGERVGVSVEELNSFIEFAKEKIGPNADLSSTFNLLASQIHPVVLGKAFRSRSQIRMLGSRLIVNQIADKEQAGKTLDFLCSDSGSHDYTINRKEALNDLGMRIEKPDETLYELIQNIQRDISDELLLAEPYNPTIYLGTDQQRSYSFRRVLLESVAGGCDVYLSEGLLESKVAQTQNGQQTMITDQRSFEGWRHENSSND